MRLFRFAVKYVAVPAAIAGAVCAQTKVDLRTQTKSVDFSAAGSTKPSKTGTALPAVCNIGETFLKTDAVPGRNLYMCTAANTWTVQGIEMPDPAGKATQVLSNNGTSFLWTAVSGDVSGAPNATIVTGLNGRRLGSLTPLDGQFLRWNGVANQWEPVSLAAALSVFGRSGAVTAQTGDYSFTQISGTVGISQLPTAGGDLNGTLSSATVTRIQGRSISSASPLAGQVLGWDGIRWIPQTVTAGEGTAGVSKNVSNTYAAGAKQTFVPDVNTSGINIAPAVLPSVPAAGDMAVDSQDANKLKVFDGTQWNRLATPANYAATFTNQTSVSIPGSAHHLGTTNLTVQCYDASTPAQRVEPDQVLIEPATSNVTIKFTNPQSGKCVVGG